jgi:hypothetical protein
MDCLLATRPRHELEALQGRVVDALDALGGRSEIFDRDLLPALAALWRLDRHLDEHLLELPGCDPVTDEVRALRRRAAALGIEVERLRALERRIDRLATRLYPRRPWEAAEEDQVAYIETYIDELRELAGL